MSESSKGELQMKDIRKILAIAGFDPSGGAGLQADIKVITAHKMYAMGAVTALTVQNTTGIRELMELPAPFVASQLEAIFEDIQPDAVKIGLLCTAPVVAAIASVLRNHKAKNIVLDPVMASTSGYDLMKKDTLAAVTEHLLPLADIVTPNLDEASAVTGFSITDESSMLKAAEEIARRFPSTAVLIKGGHLEESANDLLYVEGQARWYKQSRIDNPNTHGTGCSLSTAIACGLAAGHPLTIAVEDAKAYVTGAIRSGLNLGKGPGPLLHMWEYM